MKLSEAPLSTLFRIGWQIGKVDLQFKRRSLDDLRYGLELWDDTVFYSALVMTVTPLVALIEEFELSEPSLSALNNLRRIDFNTRSSANHVLYDLKNNELANHTEQMRTMWAGWHLNALDLIDEARSGDKRALQALHKIPNLDAYADEVVSQGAYTLNPERVAEISAEIRKCRNDFGVPHNWMPIFAERLDRYGTQFPLHTNKPLTEEPPTMKIRILFLSANPFGTGRLSLDEEFRAIKDKIRASALRDRIDIISEWAVRPDDLLQVMNEHKPHVVHFSGHGSNAEEIILSDDNGNPKPVSKGALISLFQTLRDNVQVVVLNACYSRSQAQALTKSIPCAIGMSKAIGDMAAITFAASFYRAVGFGRSVKEAFDQGVTALLLKGIPEGNTPKLLTRKGTDASKIVLVIQ